MGRLILIIEHTFEKCVTGSKKSKIMQLNIDMDLRMGMSLHCMQVYYLTIAWNG